MSEVVGQASSQLRVPTVVDELVKGIRALILSGELRPGSRLIEESLSARFGVSRPPIREALRVLQRDGIVTSISRKGFIVIPITANDVREIYALRFGLERTALELAIPVDDPEKLKPLRDALEVMRGADAQENPDVMLAANSDFHLALVGLPGNSRLNAAYSALRLQLQLCMAINLNFRKQLYHDPGDAVLRHQRLLTLIEGGELEPLLDELAHHGDRSFLTNLDEFLPAEIDDGSVPS
jgi:DNA-binding GntR family transcriptional regulator